MVDFSNCNDWVQPTEQKLEPNENISNSLIFSLQLIAFYLFKQQVSNQRWVKERSIKLFAMLIFFAEPLIDFCSTGSLGMVRLLSRDLSGRRVLHQPYIVYYNLGQITLG